MRPPATLDLKHQQAPLLRADKGHAVKAALKDKEIKPTLTSLALSTVSLDSKAPRTNGSFQRTFLQPTTKGLDDLEPRSYVKKTVSILPAVFCGRWFAFPYFALQGC